MRICIVSQEYPPGHVGGIGTQSQMKALGLAALGHEVTVITGGHDEGPMLVEREDGPVRVLEVRTPGGDFAVYETLTYWIGYTWAMLQALRSLTETSGFDLIDFPEYGGEGVAFQLDRQVDDPVAVVVHLHGSLSMFATHVGWPEEHEPLHRLGITMEDLSIQAADRVLSASQSLADFTLARNDLPPERVDVVGGSVDTTVFHPGAERTQRDEVRLLFVGHVAANKGVRTVFDAFAQLAPTRPGLRLVIAGSGDDELIVLMQADAEAAGLQDRLELLGFVEHEDLPDLYRSADIFAAPSAWEGGLGMVYLEAMACGIPVVATGAGGAAEGVLDGKTGFLLERGDLPEATRAIEVLVDDPDLRRAMGRDARAHVEARFAVEPYARRVEMSYQRAVEQRLASVVTW